MYTLLGMYGWVQMLFSCVPTCVMQGCCRLLLLDNIAAHVWLDRAAVFSSQNQQLPSSHWPAVAAQQQPHWSSQAHHPQQQSQQQQGHYQGPPLQASFAAAGASHAQGPGLDALGVQGAVAALLQALSQKWRMPVVVTKQTSVTQSERSGSSRLNQREVLTAPLQVHVA